MFYGFVDLCDSLFCITNKLVKPQVHTIARWLVLIHSHIDTDILEVIIDVNANDHVTLLITIFYSLQLGNRILKLKYSLVF